MEQHEKKCKFSGRSLASAGGRNGAQPRGGQTKVLLILIVFATNQKKNHRTIGVTPIYLNKRGRFYLLASQSLQSRSPGQQLPVRLMGPSGGKRK
jgi:hypothetical protein